MEPRYDFSEWLVNGDPTIRVDNAESAFFAQQLKAIRAAAFDVLYPELRAMQNMPMNFSVPAGAEEHSYDVYDKVGKVQLGASYATDSPRVDVKASRVTSQIKPQRNSYGTNIQESRAAALARVPLSPKKAEAARWFHAKGHDDVLLSGGLGLKGLFNQTIGDVVEYTVPNGAYGDTEWTNTTGEKTANEILADMNRAVAKVVEDSNEIYQPDTLVLPTTRYNLIKERRIGPDTSTTIMQHFLETNEYIKRIWSSIKLETAGASSSKRMVAYKNRSDMLEGIIPVEFEQFAPQARGLELVTECHSRTGGTILYHPKSALYVDQI
jgi:hypothetical protein